MYLLCACFDAWKPDCFAASNFACLFAAKSRMGLLVCASSKRIGCPGFQGPETLPPPLEVEALDRCAEAAVRFVDIVRLCVEERFGLDAWMRFLGVLPCRALATPAALKLHSIGRSWKPTHFSFMPVRWALLWTVDTSHEHNADEASNERRQRIYCNACCRL